MDKDLKLRERMKVYFLEMGICLLEKKNTSLLTKKCPVEISTTL